MNTVMMTGRIVSEPKIRQTKSGQSVASFILAVDKGLSKAKREEAETAGRPTADFPTCQAWGMTADLIGQYCGKGSKILIEGRLQTGSYEDKETGKVIYTTDVNAYKVEFLDTKGSSKQGERAQDDEFFSGEFEEVQDDGRIPF